MDKGVSLFINALETITSEFANGNNGQEFEKQIMLILDKNNFVQSSFDMKSPIKITSSFTDFNKDEYLNLLKKLKEQILSKTNAEIIKNPFSDYMNNIYIYISTFWFTTISRFFNIYKKLCISTWNKIFY